jgi:hypothetical protein
VVGCAALQSEVFSSDRGAKPQEYREYFEVLQRRSGRERPALGAVWPSPRAARFEPTPGDRRPFAITERVQQKLGGQVLQLEGTGTARLPGATRDTTVHESLASVSYDAGTGRYRLETHRAGDPARLAEGELTDGVLAWGFRDPRTSAQVRFTIQVTPEGRWLERGATSHDGTTWRGFLEMTLERQR